MAAAGCVLETIGIGGAAAGSRKASFLGARRRSIEGDGLPDVTPTGAGGVIISAASGVPLPSGNVVGWSSVSDSGNVGRWRFWCLRTRDSIGAESDETGDGRDRFKIGMATETAAPVTPPIPALSATRAAMVFQRSRGETDSAVLAARRALHARQRHGPR